MDSNGRYLIVKETPFFRLSCCKIPTQDVDSEMEIFVRCRRALLGLVQRLNTRRHIRFHPPSWLIGHSFSFAPSILEMPNRGFIFHIKLYRVEQTSSTGPGARALVEDPTGPSQGRDDGGWVHTKTSRPLGTYS